MLCGVVEVRKRCRQFYSEVAWDSSSDDQEYFFISTESESSSEDEDPAWMPQQGQVNKNPPGRVDYLRDITAMSTKTIFCEEEDFDVVAIAKRNPQ